MKRAKQQRNTLSSSLVAAVAATALTGVGALTWASAVEPRLLHTAHYRIPAPGGAKPCRVVFFSDLHFGAHTAPGTLSRLVARINAQHPDVVLFGGDLLDHANRDYFKLDFSLISASLARIRAPYGKFCVRGNHDYKKGGARFYADLMERAGFTVLTNRSVTLPALALPLYGYDDVLETALPASAFRRPQFAPGIVLCHEPDPAHILNVPARCLMLSGHTHGGQVRVPFLTRCMRPAGASLYAAGLYRAQGKNSNVDLIVSSGVGMTGLPLRFFCPPQIVVLELV